MPREPREQGDRGQASKQTNRAGEGSSTPLLKGFEAKEKESVKRKFTELDLI